MVMGEEQKGITTATWITFARLAMLPMILAFYVSGIIWHEGWFGMYGRLIALAIFLVAVASDSLDGYVARRYNQVTNLGKIFDPLADKALVMLGLVLVITDPVLVGSLDNVLPIWFAVTAVFLMLTRDFLVGALRQISIEQGAVIPADHFGKMKSIAQYAAVAIYMLFAINTTWNRHATGLVPAGVANDIFTYVAWVTLAAATVLSVASGVNYFVRYVTRNTAKATAIDKKTDDEAPRRDCSEPAEVVE